VKGNAMNNLPENERLSNEEAEVTILKWIFDNSLARLRSECYRLVFIRKDRLWF
jgi:hypothetical protein